VSNLTADHADRKLGRAPARARDFARVLRLHDFTTEELPDPPAQLDYLSAMSRVDELGNDVAGDCVVAAGMHLAQSVTAVMGRERVFTTDEALRTYGILGGWPARDEGLNMFDTAAEWQRDPSLFGDVEILGICSIDITSWRKVQQGVWLLGGLLLGFDLPKVTQRQERWQLEMLPDEQVRIGGWGGHAVHGGRRIYGADGLPAFGITTWGRVKDATSAYADVYGAECIGLLFKGWEPPNTKGFDADRLLRAMQELRR
jgi:hypothetical protein